MKTIKELIVNCIDDFDRGYIWFYEAQSFINHLCNYAGFRINTCDKIARLLNVAKEKENRNTLEKSDCDKLILDIFQAIEDGEF